MRVPRVVLEYLKRRYLPIRNRTPDEIIAPGTRWRKSRKRPEEHPDEQPNNPFLFRWFIPGYKSRWFNRYLHCFVRDDEDRALHDHPWFNLSILLEGSYIEHTIDKGGVHHRDVIEAGQLKFRTPWDAHRVELLKNSVGAPMQSWSLFLTGPVMRKKWGFHCPDTGWRSSQDFHINGGCE